MLGVSSLEVFNSVFDMNDKNTMFSLFRPANQKDPKTTKEGQENLQP